MITYINPDAIEDQSIDWSKLKNIPEFPSGGGSDTPLMTNVTYGELKELRDNGELIVGHQYRITDYITTTTQANSISAGHQFDIIVTADSENTLNEVARAIQHDGDTYFEDSDLNAWKIWYCFDNDTNRFAWADNSTPEWYSKIVANYTVDQSGTQPYSLDKDDYIYDCDSIPHPDTGVDTLVFYTQNPMYFEEAGADYVDAYFYNGITTVDGVEYDSWKKYDNEYQRWVTVGGEGEGLYALTERVVYNGEFVWPNKTENGKGVIYRMIDEYGNDCPYDFKNIKFKHPKDTTTYPDYYYTFTTLFSSIVSDHSLNNFYCRNNVIKKFVISIDEEKYCNSLNNTVFISTSSTSYCFSNSFGTDCRSNSFGDNCINNILGNDCSDNSFGNDSGFNNFSGVCNRNSFGDSCCYNNFGIDCHSNSFGNSCSYNSFGDHINSNSFGNSCSYNSFGDNCGTSIFGNECSNNSFGNSCSSNSFGISCSSNSFGNYCNANSFGNYCNANSFGNNCQQNSFRTTSSVDDGTLLNYCNNNVFDDDCRFIVIFYTSTTSSVSPLKNIKVDKSASSANINYVYYNVTTVSNTNPIFISKEYKSTSSITSIPIGLYNTSTAINNKVYTANVTVTPSKNCINASGGFYETSDERLKNFSDDVMIDLEKLSSLRKKYFTWKDGHGDQQLGVSAQEVQTLYPELVNEEDNGNLSVDYAKLSVIALSAVDKLYNRQKDFEDKLAKIEKALNL